MALRIAQVSLALTLTITHATDSLLAGSFFSFSPNSRYLYKTLGLYLWQYDLQAADIVSSRQLVHTATKYGYFAMQLGVDGKIYASTSGTSEYLHSISYPDLPGVDCGVCEDCIKLSSYNWYATPYFPNFRLGPVDGSPCDTLGLNVSVKETLSSKLEFKVFPNPAYETINFSCSQKLPVGATIVLMDAFGRALKRLDVGGENFVHSITTEGLGAGMYYLLLESEGKIIWHGKVLLQK